MVFELRKRVPAVEAAEGANLLAGFAMGSRPALCSVLFDRAYQDGTKRTTSTLLLFADGHTLKGCLKDRDSEETAWVSAETLEGLLDALEVGLQESRLDWRKDGKRRRR
jgi:hypothetical protein